MGQVYVSAVTVAAGQVPSTQTNFVKLTSKTDTRLKTIANGGHVANVNGYDIRPYSNATCTIPLTYWLEFYDGVNGILVMWVKIPSLADGYVTYFGCGDTTLTTDGSSTVTWSNGFLGQYGLGDGTTLSVVDGTGANNGTNNGVTATAGKIDGAGNFVAASSQYVALPASINAAYFSAWVNATSFPGVVNSIIVKNGTGLQGVAQFYAALTTGALHFVGNTGAIVSTTSLSAGSWYFLAVDFAVGIYINGVLDTSGSATVNTGTNLTQIGSDQAGGGRYWNGKIDEVRVCSSGRSANWITTEYNNQNAPDTFETWGTEGSVVSTYTLALTQGAYTLTGETTGLIKTTIFSLSSGSYTLNGYTVGLNTGHSIVLGQGSYVLTGEVSTFHYTRQITIVSGAYKLNGQTIRLVKDRKLTCVNGSYILTGETVSFRNNRLIQMVRGSYALTGQSLNYRYNRIFPLTRGLYVVAGQPIVFVGPFVYYINLVEGNFTPTETNLTTPEAESSLLIPKAESILSYVDS